MLHRQGEQLNSVCGLKCRSLFMLAALLLCKQSFEDPKSLEMTILQSITKFYASQSKNTYYKDSKDKVNPYQVYNWLFTNLFCQVNLVECNLSLLV